jgi:hypothetical protein
MQESSKGTEGYPLQRIFTNVCFYGTIQLVDYAKADSEGGSDG